MIASFFKTSKPFHFVIMSLLALFLFVWYRKDGFLQGFDAITVLSEVALYFVLIFSLAVITFINSKNNLTKKNSYHILLFVLFLALVPNTLKNNNILLSNLFLLLAFRRLISIKSYIDVNKKLFDAAFWIGVACLFYFWAILFFGLIFITLILFSIDRVRSWIIPFIAISTLFVLVTCYYILFENTLFYFDDIIETVSFDFTVFNFLNSVIGITFLISIGLWSLFYYWKKLRDVARVKRSSFMLVFYYLVFAIAIAIVTNNKTGSEFIFLFTPLAIITSNYLEDIENSWFSEVFVWIIFIASGAVLLL